MSRQRKRHLERQPVEEAVRQSMSEFLAGSGDVDVDRHTYDWRPDDLLVWLRLTKPVSGSVLSLFLDQVAERMHGLLPAGQLFGDWLVVVESAGKTIARVGWDDKLGDYYIEASET